MPDIFILVAFVVLTLIILANIPKIWSKIRGSVPISFGSSRERIITEFQKEQENKLVSLITG